MNQPAPRIDWLDDVGNVARDLFARFARYVRGLRAGANQLQATIGAEEDRPPKQISDVSRNQPQTKET